MDNECVLEEPSCEPPPPPADPCDGLACGDICDPCGGDEVCIANQDVGPAAVFWCNTDGECVLEEPMCEPPPPPADPCDGLACGDICDPCGGDEVCIANQDVGPAAVFWCNTDGECVLDEPMCPEVCPENAWYWSHDPMYCLQTFDEGLCYDWEEPFNDDCGCGCIPLPD
jgi:hypothetical protein